MNDLTKVLLLYKSLVLKSNKDIVGGEETKNRRERRKQDGMKEISGDA